MAVTHNKYMKYDGLNTVNYTVHRIEKQALFTRIQVSVPGPRQYKHVMSYFKSKIKEFEEKLELETLLKSQNTTN